VGAADYSTSISVLPGQTVAIVGDGGATLDTAGQAVFADNGATVMLAGMRIVGATTGVSSMGGTVWLDRMVVVENVGSGSVVVTNGTVMVRDSFLGGNANTGPAILLNGGTVDIAYSTLATGVDAPAISCSAGGVNSVIRNSLVVSRAGTPEIVGCDDLEIVTSATEMAVGENVALGDVSTGWFVNFNLGDFHLSAMAPAELAS